MSNNGCVDIPPQSIVDSERSGKSYLRMDDGSGEDIAFSIRKAMISDVREILELINGFAGRNLMLARGPQYLYENVRDFVVAVTETPLERQGHPPGQQSEEHMGRVIACASLHVLWEDVAEIRSIAIKPGFQNRGLGKKLMDFLKKDAHRLGINSLFTFTLAEDFFKSLGFERKRKEELPPKVWGECSRCPKFFKCDEVGMTLEI